MLLISGYELLPQAESFKISGCTVRALEAPLSITASLSGELNLREGEFKEDLGHLLPNTIGDASAAMNPVQVTCPGD